MRKAMSLEEVVAAGTARLRKARGWSQADLATLMRVAGIRWTRTSISNVESGQKRPSLGELLQLIRALQSSLDELQGDSLVELPGGDRFEAGGLTTILTGGAPLFAMEAAPLGEEDHEAVAHAATRLGVEVPSLQRRCRGRWGKSFTRRRDELVDEAIEARGGQVPRRSLQALRAGAARRMVAELKRGGR